jgi:ubiquinone biosynthesis protein COQ9
MIAPPERSPERDAAITGMLPHVATQGWTYAALRSALRDVGHDPLDAELLFPGGAPDMIEAYLDLADRRMEEEAAAMDWTGLSLTKRVRGLIALRFEQSRPYWEASRRAAALLALPWHAGLAARCTARTVDAIWHAAGDRAADFSWYTKRAILSGVYTATLLRWLGDTSEDNAATLAFLDRRLVDVGRIGKMRGRFEDALGRLCPWTVAV